MDYMIALIDAIAMVAFLLAFQYSWRLIPTAGESRGYWIIFSFAMLLAFAYSISSTFEWMGLSAAIFDEFEPPLMAIVTTNLSLAAILSYMSLTRPFD